MTDTIPWRKSTYSGSQANCVEVASDGAVYVRDTKQKNRPDRPVVQFTPAAWRTFTATLR